MGMALALIRVVDTNPLRVRKLFSSGKLNIHDVAETCAVVLVYYGHLEAIHMWPDIMYPDYPGQFLCLSTICDRHN